MTIGEVRELASAAAQRGEHGIADLLRDIAADRVQAAVSVRTDDGRRWWPSTTEIPVGTVFAAVSPHCDTTWQREVTGCRALPPVGTDRVYATWLIDRSWADEGLGFVEVVSVHHTDCEAPVSNVYLTLRSPSELKVRYDQPPDGHPEHGAVSLALPDGGLFAIFPTPEAAERIGRELISQSERWREDIGEVQVRPHASVADTIQIPVYRDEDPVYPDPDALHAQAQAEMERAT